MNVSNPSPRERDVSDSTLRQITQLSKLSFSELQARWRSLFGSEPPGYNRSFLVSRLAHRLQELAHGGFEYRGEQFSSLSAIARLITGTRWNGPVATALMSGRILSAHKGTKCRRSARTGLVGSTAGKDGS
jgi:hypothetical protein